jgi:hypothetical protein
VQVISQLSGLQSTIDYLRTPRPYVTWLSPSTSTMSARSRRMQGSIGSSWDDTAYNSNEDASIHTASDSGSDQDFDDSDLETVQENTDKATPLLSKTTRASLPRGYETPTNTPTRATARHSQTGSSRGAPKISSARSAPVSGEPSFIMPRASVNASLNDLMDDYANQTPTRNSQLRSRKQHLSSSRTASGASPTTCISFTKI